MMKGKVVMIQSGERIGIPKFNIISTVDEEGMQRRTVILMIRPRVKSMTMKIATIKKKPKEKKNKKEHSDSDSDSGSDKGGKDESSSDDSDSDKEDNKH